MNTLERETVTDSVTLQLGHAVELLEGAVTHAHAKSDLPTLNTVKISAAEGKVKAVATDRYRLIEGTIAGEGELSASLIPVADIKRVISLLKSEGKRMDTLPVTISRAGDMVSVSVRGNAITVSVVDGKYPDVEQYLNDTSEPVELPNISFNPALMADYAKIAGRGSKSAIGVRLVFKGERKPIKVELAANIFRKVEWQAIIMPMYWKD